MVTLISQSVFGQTYVTPPDAYYSNISVADSLVESHEYEKATHHLNLAFESFGWKGIPDDRYKAARIFALVNNYDSAFKHIEKLGAQRFFNYLKVKNEPAFIPLQKKDLVRFDSLLRKIQLNKDQYGPKQNLVWTNYLDSLLEVDQGLRRQMQKVATKKGWNSPEVKAFYPMMRVNDSLNLNAITKFIDTYGWQGEDVVGQKGNSTLFLVIQHSDSTTQEKYLPVLKKAVKSKKAVPSQLALLEDRLSVRKHGYQIYGSQLRQDMKTQKMVFEPIKNEANVDKRRKKIGLEPLSEYAKLFGIEYVPKR